MTTHTIYRITTTRNVYFASLEAARRAANDYFRRTGNIVGIVAIKRRLPK